MNAPVRTAASAEHLGLVGRSPTMHALREHIVRFAPMSATVLIQGETGTGKELVARALHTLSPRAKYPFVAANMAAISRTMLTSELFGHERGAFTGAVLRHRGLFEQAHGGTLLLDEIGELDHEAQAALLRVLETREVRPIGAESTRRLDVRLVVATHRDLAAMVRTGAFRRDLYFRLHQLVLVVSPLRERLGDLPGLVRHLLAALQTEIGERELDASAFEVLARHRWPGNVRELQSVLRRTVALTDAPVLSANHLRASLSGRRLRLTPVKRTSPVAVLDAVHAAHGNISAAARHLGVARSTVRAHLARAGLRSLR